MNQQHHCTESLPRTGMICFKDSTVQEQCAACVLECWSLQLLCCHGVPQAPSCTALHWLLCSLPLAKMISAPEPALSERPGVLEPTSAVLQWCATAKSDSLSRDLR
eukprot:944333-Rhodomonas_salina.1